MDFEVILSKCVDLFDHICVKLDMHRLNGLGDLFGAFGTQQRDTHSRLSERPSDYQLSDRVVEFICEVPKFVKDVLSVMPGVTLKDRVG